MAVLKSYTCSKCGGVLNFDEGQEIFSCPFCGNEFAATDFHREELLAQAADSLKRLKYDTARSKYKILLNKNPKDFEALLGMVLAECRIDSIQDLESPEKLRDCDFKAARKSVEAAIEASEEGREYFEKLSDLIDIARSYNAARQGVEASALEARNQFRNIAETERNIDEAKDAEKERLTGIGKEIFRFLFPLLLVGVSLASINVTAIIFGVLIAAAVIILDLVLRYYFLKKKLTKAPRQRMMTDQSKEDRMRGTTADLKNSYLKRYQELKELDPARDGYTPPVPSRSAPSVAFTNVEETVVCSKCGGQLLLEKDKGLYECRFCGVAYGASLFFNDPLLRAKKAMKSGDFSEADQRFSHVLMMDHHDFDALKGRILCAGKWKTFKDIELPQMLIPVVKTNLIERADEAVKHASEEHRTYFEDFRKLIDIIISNAANEKKLKQYENILKSESKNSSIEISHPGKYEDLGKHTELIINAKACDKKRSELLYEFNKHKTLLMNQEKKIRCV